MKKSSYPISFYHNFDLDSFNLHRKDFDDVGATLIMSPYYTKNDHAKVIDLLDWAATCEMKLMMFDYRTIVWSYWKEKADGYFELDENAYRAGVKEAYAEYGSHPAFFCFYVIDEPTYQNYDACCRASSIIREETGCEGHINLRPFHQTVYMDIGTHDYEKYLEEFLKDSKCEFLCHDYYAHLSQNGYTSPEFFKNMMYYNRVAKKLGRTFWHVILGSSLIEYREMTYDDLRMQASCSLAYGSKGIFYYTFAAHCGTSDRFGVLDAWGERTYLFNEMRRVNREIHDRYNGLFMELTLDKTTHFPRIPHFEVQPFVADETIAGMNINLHGRNDIHVIVSNFTDPRNGDKYVYLVNASTTETYCLNVWFTKAKKITGRLLTGTLYEIGMTKDENTGYNMAEFYIAPGQGELIKID